MTVLRRTIKGHQEIVLEATYEQTVTLRIGTVEKEIVLKENEIIKLGNDIV